MIKLTIIIFSLFTVVTGLITGLTYLAEPFVNWTYTLGQPLGLFVFMLPLFFIMSIMIAFGIKVGLDD